jgi:hypothetical protein
MLASDFVYFIDAAAAAVLHCSLLASSSYSKFDLSERIV